MSDACCRPPPPSTDPAYRQALRVALVANLLMFMVEVATGWTSDSVSLLADAIDFMGDSANYGLSLAVLAMGLRARSRAAMGKAACMAGFGVFVLVRAAWGWQHGAVPEATTMGVVATAALATNVGVALMLYRLRQGDANMRSVWLCSRNDAIGNLAVVAAALGVFGTGRAWPDLLVAVLMAALALSGAASVLRQAAAELALTARRT